MAAPTAPATAAALLSTARRVVFVAITIAPWIQLLQSGPDAGQVETLASLLGGVRVLTLAGTPSNKPDGSFRGVAARRSAARADTLARIGFVRLPEQILDVRTVLSLRERVRARGAGGAGASTASQ